MSRTFCTLLLLLMPLVVVVVVAAAVVATLVFSATVPTDLYLLDAGDLEFVDINNQVSPPPLFPFHVLYNCCCYNKPPIPSSSLSTDDSFYYVDASRFQSQCSMNAHIKSQFANLPHRHLM